MLLMGAASFTRASGRRFGPGIESFLGFVKWHRVAGEWRAQKSQNRWFYEQEPTLERPTYKHNNLRVHTSIPTCAYAYVSQRKTKEVKSPPGRFQGPYCGGWGSRCIK